MRAWKIAWALEPTMDTEVRGLRTVEAAPWSPLSPPGWRDASPQDNLVHACDRLPQATPGVAAIALRTCGLWLSDPTTTAPSDNPQGTSSPFKF